MNLNIWYSRDVDQWRWTFTDDMEMESGSNSCLQTAMKESQAVALNAISKEFTGRANCYNNFERNH